MNVSYRMIPPLRLRRERPVGRSPRGLEVARHPGTVSRNAVLHLAGLPVVADQVDRVLPADLRGLAHCHGHRSQARGLDHEVDRLLVGERVSDEIGQVALRATDRLTRGRATCQDCRAVDGSLRHQAGAEVERLREPALVVDDHVGAADVDDVDQAVYEKLQRWQGGAVTGVEVALSLLRDDDESVAHGFLLGLGLTSVWRQPCRPVKPSRHTTRHALSDKLVVMQDKCWTDRKWGTGKAGRGYRYTTVDGLRAKRRANQEV